MIIDSKQKEASESALPNYETAVQGQQQRNQPSTYLLTPWTGTSMLVVPQSNQSSHDVQPLYRITVELDLNPLIPVSYTTRITRCGRKEGELVGEFSLSLNSTRAVLRMGDHSTRLSRVLYSVNSSPRHFNWILSNRLHWDCRKSLDDGSPMCICYFASPKSADVGPGPGPSHFNTPPLPPIPHPLNMQLPYLPPSHLHTPLNFPPIPFGSHHFRARSPAPPSAYSQSSSQVSSQSSSSSGTTSTATSKPSIQIASFIPPPPEASPPLPDAVLTLFPTYSTGPDLLGSFPSGEERDKLMDEIVVSALVIERMLNR